MPGDAILGAVVAFCLATLTTPVGVSGAVFLVPFQISVVETPSPAITPTNLLFNLIAIPGALVRFHREGRLAGPLSRLLVLGTLPGVVAGALVRVTLLDQGEAFLIVVAAVLFPLGAWLVFGRPPRPAAPPDRRRRRQIVVLSLAIGTVGGIYGIGGGSVLAPILVGLGFSVYEVAPAALLATFLTSLAGVLAYALLSLGVGGDVAPDWTLGLGMGIGGLAGANLGARFQSRLPEALLRRGLGLLALALGARYAVQALG
ncbi:MAG TPA: TSUP family transporter [Solirubrobacterales bacterium]|nr:TSUP family transporter [Solirubrobacterales bacterium]